MKKLGAVALVIVAAVIINICLVGCNRGGIAVSYTLINEPVTLDPQIASDENAFTVIEALFDGLTSIDEDGSVKPCVSSSWDVSSDGKTYTFHISENAKWSDGQKVKAGDFVFAWRRALDPSTQSSTCQSMFIIENAMDIHLDKKSNTELGAVALDDNTLQIKLTYPTEDILYLLSTAVFMPCREDFFYSTNGRYGLDSQMVLGNGGFCMENKYSWEHGEYINLIRDGDYSGDILPYRINFTIADGKEQNPFRLIEDGNTASLVPGNYLAQLDASALNSISKQDITLGICFNTQSDDLSDKDTRLRMIDSLNREELERVASGYGKAASGVVPDCMLFNGRSYREQAGKINLNSIQYDMEKDTDIPTLTLLCEDTSSGWDTANAVINSWNSEYGKYFNIEPLTTNELLRRVQSGDFDVALLPVTGDGESVTAMMYQFSQSGKHYGLLESDDYDKLIDPVKSTTGDVLTDCKKAEQLLVNEGVFYPIFSMKTTLAFNKSTSGLVLMPFSHAVNFYSVRN